MSTTLVIGASGVLAPAAAKLVRTGDTVTGVSLRRPVPTGVEHVLVDARSVSAFSSAINERCWNRAVVYAPAVSSGVLKRLDSAVEGVIVLVRTTAAVTDTVGRLELPPGTLQLGWTDAPDGKTRWHTPEEISQAALEVLNNGRATVLGRITPWADRP
ncbi:MAG: hypothetical protein B5766_02255 [Candidatus Lumbricidophila eiseniae]|uniref:NAD-dependent epimerase/dehydratase domain-containing protein n=1 Tax=Candidatus Lumbricidiphila eiseniae TaxID=1969409 RepID=A0A2A6FTF0_9MICO|nr:MAG: hypothetical protein B5766_02255 [Candidatus Lumbricidophila eiseniae]